MIRLLKDMSEIVLIIFGGFVALTLFLFFMTFLLWGFDRFVEWIKDCIADFRIQD